MKRQFLLMRLLLLFALIVGSGNVWAGTVILTENFSSSSASNNQYDCGSNATTSGMQKNWDYAWTPENSVYVFKSGIRLGKGSGTPNTGKVTNTTMLSGISTGTSITIKVYAARWNTDTGNLTVTYNGNSESKAPANSAITSTSSTYSATAFSSSTNFSITKANDVTSFSIASSSKRIIIDRVEVVYDDGPADTRTATTTAINVPDGFKTDLAGSTDVNAGTLTATVTPDGSSALVSPSITWSSSDENVATITPAGVVTLKAVGTTNITVNYGGDENYKESEDTYVLKVVDTYAKGQVNNPYTVAEAIAAIDAAGKTTISNVYVKGYISQIDSYSSPYITYWISDDGTITNQFEVYKGLNIGGASFSAITDLGVSDYVVIKGNITYYSDGGIYEFAKDNELVSKISKETPTFTLNKTEASLEAYNNESTDVTLTTNTDGDITCESNNEDVATVALKSGNVYTITAQTTGIATITIRSAMSGTYKPASATVTVTVNDSREDAGISFAEGEIVKTWGESFTGQALSNTHSLGVTWSSTDEAVATVNSTGEVNVLKAGSTTIKATFDGDATYKAAVASYNLTINKADAGISYAETAFDIMLNDASFVAPTLQNPNGLTGITYSSNNETVAVVDENTGELVYDKNATGTAKITASFAGNDWYKSGSANYTINIVDPTIKGSKYNPYTVEEVIDGTATGNGIYVRGFIVGEYVGSATAPRTSGFNGNSNIAIADEFTNSPTASGSIPVQLGVTALQNAWGCKITKGALLGYEVLIKGNAQDYFSVKGIKSTSEVSAVSVPVTITDAKYATFCSPYKLDYSSTVVKAYAAKVNGNSVKLTEVENGIVPANAGVVLYCKTAGTYAIPVTTEDATDYDALDNELIGINERTLVAKTASTKTNYILSNEDKASGVGFYLAADDGAYLPAHRAYLSTTSATASRSFLGFDDETTGIETINTNPETVSGVQEYYNLNGQRVANPSKGLYIVNGKKVIINK